MEKRPRFWHKALSAVAICALLTAGNAPVRTLSKGLDTNLFNGGAVIGNQPAHTATDDNTEQVLTASRQTNISFEENRGQFDAQAKFISRAGGQTVFLTADAAWFVLPMTDTETDAGTWGRGDAATEADDEIRNPQFAIRNQKMYAVKMSIEGANTQAQVVGENELAGRVNYFRGNDSEKWQTDVKTFGAVRYEGIYEGIDLVYYGNEQREMEYDFRIAAGADAKQISLKFDGALGVELDATGDLRIKTPAGELRQRKPFVFQETNGLRAEVASGYAVEGDGRVRFSLGEYDRSRPLIIDPVLGYSSYLGGTNQENGNDIAVDAAGNAYITGFTLSTNFPTFTGAYDQALEGGADAYVAKFNPNKTGNASLIYTTYLGGNLNDLGVGIAVDAAGNAYVTGNLDSTNFPTTSGAFSRILNGVNDVFITKLNSTGSALVYSTYLGGSAVIGNTTTEGVFDIAVDSGGNAYVVGNTNTTNFPVTPGAFDTTFGGGTFVDGFVTKLNAAGTNLVYSTYLGGNSIDNSRGIAVDAAGNAYLTGSTFSTNFPATPGAFQTTYNASAGRPLAFITKLNPTGSVLVYSTFFGSSGGGEASGRGIAIDAAGNAYVTGDVFSNTLPTTPGAFDTTFNGGGDVFVTKLNPTGTNLVYSTYLGGSIRFGGSGSDQDQPQGIAVDTAGNAYVTGSTSSADFPLADPLPMGNMNRGGSSDAFVTKLNTAGSALVYSTYFGAENNEAGLDIAVDTADNAYIVGNTNSTALPTTFTAYQQALSGGTSSDAFFTKIEDTTPNTPTGSNVEVQSSSGDARVSFSQVTTTGKTTFTPINPPSSAGAPPSGFTILNNAPAFDIMTTAAFTPPVTVCFTVGSITSEVEFARVRILHGENGRLVDRTILAPDSPAPDFAIRSVCARVNTLSPFVTALAPAAADIIIIEGFVRRASGAPVVGATVTLTGSAQATILTGTDGHYRFTVPSGGSYQVSVAAPRQRFSPAQQSFNSLTVNQTADFTAFTKGRTISRSRVR